MYDNGLLKYYKQKAYKDGVLPLEDLPAQQLKKSGRIRVYNINGSRFYTKAPRDFNLKRAFDPEILLSQIYAKAGISSALYLPASVLSSNIIVSNDVATNSSIQLACNFISSVIDSEDRNNLDFLNPNTTFVDYSKYFTLRALQQQTKLRVFDTASYNSDRHDENFYYKVLSYWNQQETVDAFGQTSKTSTIVQKADDVLSIDYELSGFNSFKRMSLSDVELDMLNQKGCYYHTDFNGTTLLREEVLDEFRGNELFANLVDKKELAEEIGSVSPMAVAQDIKDTIGYEVEPKYAEFLERSFEEVAETLIQQ